MQTGTTVPPIERTDMTMRESKGSGISPSEEPELIGECRYCRRDIHSDEEHYEFYDGTMYCSEDCLLKDLERYHYMGEIG